MTEVNEMALPSSALIMKMMYDAIFFILVVKKKKSPYILVSYSSSDIQKIVLRLCNNHTFFLLELMMAIAKE